MATNLTADDIAITGFNFDNPDELTFVTLVDITEGTEINFTDNGWLSSGSFRSTEGTFTWTAPADISAGTSIKPAVSGVAFSASGDQIIAYQGEAANPTFLYALNSEGNGLWQENATSSNTSALPTGLVNGETAVALSEIDNAIYTGTTSGSKVELLAAISNSDNWSGSNSDRQSLSTTPFTVAGSTSLVINEVLGSTAGTDVEFIELFGAAGTSLAGLSIIVVESDAGASNGSIDRRVDLGSDAAIGDNGFFLIGNTQILQSSVYGVTPNQEITSNFIENSSYTIALVETASLAGDSVAGSEVVIDAVGVTDGGADDSFFFDAPVVGPDGSFLPAGVRRVETGVDTDSVSDWVIGDFFIGPDNTPTAGTSDDDNGGGGEETIRLISEVQGGGDTSPLVGETVTVEAVVVGDYQDGSGSDGDLNGFFVQEEDADIDGDTATSEGLFIFDGSNPAVDVQVGDKVKVTGTVTEFNGLTELTNVAVSVEGTDSLPSAATVSFPVSDVDTLESFEGMRVTIPDTLFVTEYFNLDRFGEVVLSSNGDSNAPGTDGRLDQYTQFNDPSVEGFAAYQEAIANRRIVLDDGQTVQNPDTILYGRGGEPLSSDNTLRGGDTVTNLTGILSFGFGDYRIQPTGPVDFQPTNPRPTEPEPVGGSLKVVSFNVLNFFTTLDIAGNPGSGPNDLEPRGADSQLEFDRQLTKLVAAIEVIDADVLGLVELENEFGGDQNGDGQFAIQTLVDTLNARAGSDVYSFVDPGRPFVDTGDAISVGAIYKNETVKLAQGTTVEILDDSDLPSLGLAFDNAVFDGPSTNRAALAATFEEVATGEQVTVAVNHFKSKGSVNPAPGNEDAGDGAGNNNAIRLQAAQALDAWLDSDPTQSGDSDFLIIGDLNSYAQEDPIVFLESEGYVNVVDNPESAYSFVFDGQYGTLDYGLANNTLISQVTGATEWHVNADEPDALDYNLDFGRDPNLFDGSTPYRNSDHDPLIIGLDLFTPGETIDGGNGKDSITGSEGSDILTGGNGKDTLAGGNGRDTLDGGNGKDILIGGRGDDLLTGGRGADIFVVDANSGTDTITDFRAGQDVIGLRDGLSFGALTLSTQGDHTLISLGEDAIAKVIGITELSQSSFVSFV